MHARMLLAATLVLVLFLGLTGGVLDRAFRTSSEKAQRERLSGHIYALLAAADENTSGLVLPKLLPDPRFNNPESGFYAEVVGIDADLNWHSASLVGQKGQFARQVESGQWSFYSWNDDRLAVTFGITWEGFDGSEQRYLFAAAEDMRPFMEQLQAYRRTLWQWLGGAAIVLLLVQGWVLRWSLKPLREVAEELSDIESGSSNRLSGDHPAELAQLTDSINSLIHHAETRQQRVRNSLDDLAHSMKTPLAILQGVADNNQSLEAEQCQTVQQQVARMNDIVSHQLQRASVSGRTTLVKAIPLAPVVQQIIRSLEKVYIDKSMESRLQIPESLSFYGDEGDLMEVLGNLLDNAWKYGASVVQVVAEEQDGLTILIENDGAGIPESQLEQVLERGRRLDQQQPGQGIGLTVADEIVSAYGGQLSIGRASLGGVVVSIFFPVGN